MKYEAIIFDLFGTLVYRRLKLNFFRYFDFPGSREDFDITKANLYVMSGDYPDAKSMADALGLEYTQEQLSQAQKAIDTDTDNIVLMHDAIQAIEYAKTISNKVYCLSNLATPWANAIKKFDLLDKFDGVFLSCETGKVKPTIDAFKQIPCDPSKTLMVGDKVIDDGQGALNAGMYVILRGQNIVDSIKWLIESTVEWIVDDDDPKCLHGEIGGEKVYQLHIGERAQLVYKNNIYVFNDVSTAKAAINSSLNGDTKILDSFKIMFELQNINSKMQSLIENTDALIKKINKQ
jgi:HAD superfamily hydrolase (TIGR01549 family)